MRDSMPGRYAQRRTVNPALDRLKHPYRSFGPMNMIIACSASSTNRPRFRQRRTDLRPLGCRTIVRFEGLNLGHKYQTLWFVGDATA
jgi:hypothetical protein